MITIVVLYSIAVLFLWIPFSIEIGKATAKEYVYAKFDNADAVFSAFLGFACAMCWPITIPGVFVMRHVLNGVKNG